MASASREWTVPCPVALVWQVATDLSHTAWRSDLKRVNLLEPGQYVETTKDGVPNRLTVLASEPYRRYALSVEGKATYGTRELLFDGDERQTAITIRDELLGKNLFLTLMEGMYVREFQKRYLRDLNNELHRIVHREE